MKPQELRVGNWIQINYDGPMEKFQIEAIGKDAEGFSDYYIKHKGGASVLMDEDEELVFPIKLNDDIIQKLGFTKKGSTSWYHKYKTYLTFVDGHLGVEHDSNPLNVDPIEFVHQMQNLFFVTQGEELTTEQL